jgi:hypothetical protein
MFKAGCRHHACKSQPAETSRALAASDNENPSSYAARQDTPIPYQSSTDQSTDRDYTLRVTDVTVSSYGTHTTSTSVTRVLSDFESKFMNSE